MSFFVSCRFAKMPGPFWKQTVNQLDKDIERCKAQAARLDQSHEEVFQGQVYRNSNTVVEVSIKTKKDKKREHEHSDKQTKKSCSKDDKIPSSMRGRKIMKKKLNSERDQTDSPTWSKVLTAKSNTLKDKNFSEHKNDANVDNVDGGEKVGNKNVFKSRTLNVFLKEMRAALSAENVDAARARAVLDDLEFVSMNMDLQEKDAKVSRTEEIIPNSNEKEQELKRQVMRCECT
jgi:hypothetical protein